MLGSLSLQGQLGISRFVTILKNQSLWSWAVAAECLGDKPDGAHIKFLCLWRFILVVLQSIK